MLHTRTHVDPAKLVGENRLIAVTERIEVEEPEQPSLHRKDRNHVSSISDMMEMNTEASRAATL